MNMLLVQIVTVSLLASDAFAEKDRILLEGEPSRDELALYAQRKETRRAFPRQFEFPKDVVKDKIFGIDVSHYQGKINWDRVQGQGVQFVYVKATQGINFYDGQFDENWKALGSAKNAPTIRRGAYHFLTALGDPESQAANYLSVIGELTDKDLPPCIDIEWDFRRRKKTFVRDKHGRNIDQWASLSSVQIVSKLKMWLTKVENATGKRPIIYTHPLWWNERIGNGSELTDYRMWISDYTSKSLGREQPRVPLQFRWAIWQLTDKGILPNANITQGLDTSVVQSDVKDLEDGFK